MKQILFLLLFPCLAMAQYTGNANQKITLGEQTTADGLVYRGVAFTDTVTATSKITRANKQDTSVYLLLDTVTNLLWHYRTASNGWTQAGGSTLDTATMLLPYYRAGRNTIIQAADVPTLNQNTTGSAATLTTGRTILTNLASTSAATFNGSANITPGVTGVLPLGNGGTNTSTAFMAGSVVFAGTGGTYAQDNGGLFYDNTNDRLGIGTTTPLNKLDIAGNISLSSGGANVFRILQSVQVAGYIGPGFYSQSDIGYGVASNSTHRFMGGLDGNTELMRINGSGNVGIGTPSPSEKLHVVGNARITAMNGINDIGASATGVLQAATSDMNLKNTIENSPFGLNEILLLNPVTFLYNDENRKIDSDVKEVGFIAQDVFDVIPNAVSSTGTGDLQLDYRAITAALVKAIQEQTIIIKQLEQRILNLENK